MYPGEPKGQPSLRITDMKGEEQRPREESQRIACCRRDEKEWPGVLGIPEAKPRASERRRGLDCRSKSGQSLRRGRKRRWERVSEGRSSATSLGH